MAFDITSLIALFVAAVALLVAGIQVTQQLMATGYVIRKCDQVVAGGLTQGGTRQWHFRQCRFTVSYEAITFSFPESLYSSLGISSAIQVKISSPALWIRARELSDQRTSAQGCWVSFIQDVLDCIPRDHLSTRWESADRVPDDLTVAPIRVDAITVMLLGVASGMSLSKYEPTTGEISMSGQSGAISSSVHPILGGLIHYTPSAVGFTPRGESLERHAKAVWQGKGVWANAVFGRFNDRSYGRGYVGLRELRLVKKPIVESNGWPAQCKADTEGTACCFMAFANVDVYETVPPSSVNGWCAHFAEVIVRAHLLQIRNAVAVETPEPYKRLRERFIEDNGCSSPHLPWNELRPPAPPLNNSDNQKPLPASGSASETTATTAEGTNNPDNLQSLAAPGPATQITTTREGADNNPDNQEHMAAPNSDSQTVDVTVDNSDGQHPFAAPGPSTKTSVTTADSQQPLAAPVMATQVTATTTTEGDDSNPNNHENTTTPGSLMQTITVTIEGSNSNSTNQLPLAAPSLATQTIATTTEGANNPTEEANANSHQPLANPKPDTQAVATSIKRSNNIPEKPTFLAIPELKDCAATHGNPDSRTDPSSFIPISAAYEAILCADDTIHKLRCKNPEVVTYAEKIVARSIATLADVGPPSWGRAAADILRWPETVGDACRDVRQTLAKENSALNTKMEDLLEYAHLYILRASYYTIIMRASGKVGPAFDNQAVPVTALAYMA